VKKLSRDAVVGAAALLVREISSNLRKTALVALERLAVVELHAVSSYPGLRQARTPRQLVPEQTPTARDSGQQDEGMAILRIVRPIDADVNPLVARPNQRLKAFARLAAMPPCFDARADSIASRLEKAVSALVAE